MGQFARQSLVLTSLCSLSFFSLPAEHIAGSPRYCVCVCVCVCVLEQDWRGSSVLKRIRCGSVERFTFFLILPSQGASIGSVVVKSTGKSSSLFLALMGFWEARCGLALDVLVGGIMSGALG